MITNYVNFEDAVGSSIFELKNQGTDVDAGRWQGVPTKGKPDLVTLELMDVAFRVHMPGVGMGAEYPVAALSELVLQIKPNLPWADMHFLERVSRDPSNPGESYKFWPWWRGQDEKSMIQENQTSPEDFDLRFSHTYQERFWPKMAGRPQGSFEYTDDGNKGIRYTYGDLDDVVNMLLKDPQTRQAYLPIFFPEDTGAVHGGRIPCTLGYHFLLRNDQLHLWYDIRSCDAVRHFRDDLYLAARLALWVIEECCQRQGLDGPGWHWRSVRPGVLTFHAHSFHVHKGDLHLL